MLCPFIFFTMDLIEYQNKIIDKIYDKIIEYPLKINSIFTDYFGNDRVDLQELITKEDVFSYIKGYHSLMSGIYKLLDTDIIKEECSPEDLIEFRHNIYTKKCPESILYKYLQIIDKHIDIVVKRIKCILNENTEYVNSIIYFPKVTVTNENGKSIDITKLFIKVIITYDGNILTFKAVRSEFTKSQFNCDYIHSHVQLLDKNNIESFKNCCVGTGPIRTTLTTLSRSYNEDIIKLFCVELDSYVKTESIAGIPYMYLESVGNNAQTRVYDLKAIYRIYNESCYTQIINNFIVWFVHNKPLKFNYLINHYGIAMSFKDFYIYISNAFIEWYNTYEYNNCPKQDLFSNSILIKGKIKDNILYTNFSDYYNLKYKNVHVLWFKGRDITLNIIDDSKENNNINIFLNIKLAQEIYSLILNIVNYGIGQNGLSFRNNNSEKTIFI